MESLGVFPDGELECFKMLFANEELEYFTPQFLGQNSILLGGEGDELNIGLMQSTFENEHIVFHSLDADHHNSNFQYTSQESSYNSSNCSDDNNVFIANTNYYLSCPDNLLANYDASMDFCMDEGNFASFVPSLNDIVMKENVNYFNDALENSDHQSQMELVDFPTKQMQLKRKLEVPEDVPAEDRTNKRSENHQKKKPHVLKDAQGCMKNARSKKNQKLARNGNDETAEETYAGSDGQSSSSNISEDDNNSVSQSAHSNGKTRASRGSATDPQSLYARKRRERINERLRILQNLVPNGTKVDISTMLEEAVNYVKFLQLQIKLLSSDDLWMYAPLAYNGLDIGLNLNPKNSPTL